MFWLVYLNNESLKVSGIQNNTVLFWYGQKTLRRVSKYLLLCPADVKSHTGLEWHEGEKITDLYIFDLLGGLFL